MARHVATTIVLAAAVTIAPFTPAATAVAGPDTHAPASTSAVVQASPAGKAFAPGRYGTFKMGSTTRAAIRAGLITDTGDRGPCTIPFVVNQRWFWTDGWVYTNDALTRVGVFGLTSPDARSSRGVRLGATSLTVYRKYPKAKFTRDDYGGGWLSVGSRSGGWLDFTMSKESGSWRVVAISARAGRFPLYASDGC